MHRIDRVLPFILISAGSTLFAIGCQEPGYRNEVSTSPQGAVEVHHVPKDAASQDPGQGATSRPDAATEQRLAALEAQVLELKAEVSRLNSSNVPNPATKP